MCFASLEFVACLFVVLTMAFEDVILSVLFCMGYIFGLLGKGSKDEKIFLLSSRSCVLLCRTSGSLIHSREFAHSIGGGSLFLWVGTELCLAAAY